MKAKQNLLQTCRLAAMLLMLPAIVQAQFNYITNNGTITITGYTGSGGAASIPTTINGLPVTSIGNSAFAECSLTNITIPNSVTSIGEWAFERCYSLANVNIGSGVTNIFFGAFSECQSLTAINVDAANFFYASMAGILFDKNLTTLILFPKSQAGSYIVLDSVSSIGDSAFNSCTNLTSVTIPNSVTNVGVDAFADCGSLTNVIFGNGVISIGHYAFIGCTSLTSITIPASVTSMGEFVFEDCSLTSITISDGVTSIGESTFGDCLYLTNVTIPNSVTSIGGAAFENCTHLSSVSIGSGVTNIGDSAFYFCTSLTAINVDAANSVYASMAGVLVDKSLTTLILFPMARAGSYTIPNGITSIGDSAFYQCNLTSVTIPGSVSNIGDAAFNDCFALTSVYFLGNSPAAESTVFARVTNAMGAILNFYYATVYYLSNTLGWVNFATNHGVPTAIWLPQVQTGDGSFGVRTNQFGFNIAWASGQTLVVETCSNLSDPVWTPVATNTLTSDSVYFSDPQWTNYPARFYRLRSP